MQTVL
jgi:hypothetical protein